MTSRGAIAAIVMTLVASAAGALVLLMHFGNEKRWLVARVAATEGALEDVGADLRACRSSVRQQNAFDPMLILTAYPGIARVDDVAFEHMAWDGGNGCSAVLVGSPISMIRVSREWRRGAPSEYDDACLRGLVDAYTPSLAGRESEFLGRLSTVGSIEETHGRTVLVITANLGRGSWTASVYAR